MKEHERMLPGDFQKKIKKERYDKCENTEKEPKRPKGFFIDPKGLKGDQDQGERDFLVFYFDSKQEYLKVRKLFEIKTSMRLSHPDLDSHKLFRLVKKELENEKDNK